MKKVTNTKKIIAVACILTLALFIFPFGSFAKKGGAEKGCVVTNSGNIEDLVFDFGDGFVLELPGLDEVTVLEVIVYAGGRETTVVAPKEKYIYNNSLSEGWDWDGDGDGGTGDAALVPLPVHGKRLIYAFTEDYGYLVFEFKSATLFEHFKIKKRQIDAACNGGEVRVPKKVDLFFEVKEAQLIGPKDILDYLGSNSESIPQPLNFIIEIIDGKPVHSEVWYPPPTAQNKIGYEP